MRVKFRLWNGGHFVSDLIIRNFRLLVFESSDDMHGEYPQGTSTNNIPWNFGRTYMYICVTTYMVYMKKEIKWSFDGRILRLRTPAMYYAVSVTFRECQQWEGLNTLRPRQNGRHFADDIFKCIFLDENVWIAIDNSLKIVLKGSMNNFPALVQIMAWRRLGDKPLSEPMMVRLPTHICVTRPQWVKPMTNQESGIFIRGNLQYMQMTKGDIQFLLYMLMWSWWFHRLNPVPNWYLCRHLFNHYPGQNGRHFADDIFRCNFVNEMFLILIQISFKFVPEGPIDNNPVLD